MPRRLPLFGAGFAGSGDLFAALEVRELDLGVLAPDQGGPVLAVEIANGGVEVQRGALDGVELVAPVVHRVQGGNAAPDQEPSALVVELGPVERVEEAVHGVAHQVARWL